MAHNILITLDTLINIICSNIRIEISVVFNTCAGAREYWFRYFDTYTEYTIKAIRPLVECKIADSMLYIHCTTRTITTPPQKTPYR